LKREVRGAAGTDVRFIRDPTRGGLASVANGITEMAGLGIDLDEAAIPIRPEVLGMPSTLINRIEEQGMHFGFEE
jgi:hydrogenase expression/formation protein HypE